MQFVGQALRLPTESCRGARRGERLFISSVLENKHRYNGSYDSSAASVTWFSVTPTAEHVIGCFRGVVALDAGSDAPTFHMAGILKVKIFPITMCGIIAFCAFHHTANPIVGFATRNAFGPT